MRYPLHFYCLFLCKTCSSQKHLFAQARQNQTRNWQGKQSGLLAAAINYVAMIKVSAKDQFRKATSGHRAEPVEVWKARKFIEEHSDEEVSLRRVAKAVSISPNHLSEKFKQVTGVNFVDYVARARFETARDRLLNSNRRISEIAFAAGFQSLSQFNRVFKKLSGKSPTEYRVAHLRRRKRR